MKKLKQIFSIASVFAILAILFFTANKSVYANSNQGALISLPSTVLIGSKSNFQIKITNPDNYPKYFDYCGWSTNHRSFPKSTQHKPMIDSTSATIKTSDGKSVTTSYVYAVTPELEGIEILNTPSPQAIILPSLGNITITVNFTFPAQNGNPSYYNPVYGTVVDIYDISCHTKPVSPSNNDADYMSFTISPNKSFTATQNFGTTPISTPISSPTTINTPKPTSTPKASITAIATPISTIISTPTTPTPINTPAATSMPELTPTTTISLEKGEDIVKVEESKPQNNYYGILFNCFWIIALILLIIFILLMKFVKSFNEKVKTKFQELKVKINNFKNKILRKK